MNNFWQPQRFTANALTFPSPARCAMPQSRKKKKKVELTLNPKCSRIDHEVQQFLCSRAHRVALRHSTARRRAALSSII